MEVEILWAVKLGKFKGDKIKIGYLTPAFLGAHMREGSVVKPSKKNFFY